MLRSRCFVCCVQCAAPTPQRLRAMAASGVRPSSAAQVAAPVSSIKRGAAMRAKHQNNDKPQAIIPGLVAQHPENRGGMAINSNRTDQLLSTTLGHFDDEEACHGAVAVEERPGCSAIHEYDLKKHSGNPALAGVSDAGIPYGSVGASNINQLFGATTELCREIADADGKLNLNECAQHSSQLVALCWRSPWGWGSSSWSSQSGWW